MMSKHIFQKEPVLSIATCLAIISAFFVPPDAEYLGYIDFANDSYGRTERARRI